MEKIIPALLIIFLLAATLSIILSRKGDCDVLLFTDQAGLLIAHVFQRFDQSWCVLSWYSLGYYLTARWFNSACGANYPYQALKGGYFYLRGE